MATIAERERRRTHTAQRTTPAALAAAALLVAIGCGAPQPREISGWDVSDESNTAQLDHSAWQDILDAYVAPDAEGVNLTDYAALKANPADAAKLAGYIEYLEGIDPRDHARAEQMAYWINLYNALTVKVVLDAYPVDSIRDIHEGLVPLTGPWGDVRTQVAGQGLTLDDIEHGILRPIWQESRIHYAVNCAAYGCPHLIDTAFTAANTESLLAAGARFHVNSFRGVDVVDEDFVVLSSIYDWYAEDFGDSRESLFDHLRLYADDELAAFLATFEGAVEYDYDWSLNEPGRAN